MDLDELRFLWCDGFIPSEYILTEPGKRITGQVWMCNGGRQDSWTFSLALPSSVLSMQDIDWRRLLPTDDVTGWLHIDQEHKHLDIRVSSAVLDDEPEGSMPISHRTVECEVTRRQSTFWEIQTDVGRERVHFFAKEEFYFIEAQASFIDVLDDHPVLLDYRHSWEKLFIASPVASPGELHDKIVQGLRAFMNSWRPPDHYLNDGAVPKILRQGHGLLLEAPIPVAAIARAIIHEAGARYTTLPGRPGRWPRKALVIGRNFVVARSFRTELAP